MRSIKSFSILLILILISGIMLVSCSGGGSPMDPASDPILTEEPREAAVLSNRYLLGLWTVSIDPVNETWEIVPKRDASFHAEIRYFLEKAPCNNCLLFEEMIFYPNDTVAVKVRITHPFDDPFLDGFDVRAVPILASTHSFGSEKISYDVLQNPDGWTGLWDSTAIPGTLNPFVAFRKSVPRRRFAAGSSSAEWMTFDFSQTGWVFDYAIDASWDWPDGTNFPPTANCEEAYNANTSLDGNLNDADTNPVNITVTAYDWQGHNTVQSITVRAPAIFNNALTLTKTQGVGNVATFQGTINNTLLAPQGIYPMLIQVTDQNHTSSNMLRLFKMEWITVDSGTPPPSGSVTIINPTLPVDKYVNISPYVNNITAQVTPPDQGVTLQWWWFDPDEPASAGAYGEGGSWETNTDPNDNYRDSMAWIVGNPNAQESFPGPSPPAEYHYRTTQTNSSGLATVTFKVSDYGGDNYEVHVRRIDTMDEDTAPVITVRRKVTLYKNSMRSAGGSPGFYEPDHAQVQGSYAPAYIDFEYVDYNMNVTYQSPLPSDANWLYSWAEGIYSPGAHQLSDVGSNRFDNSNILGIAIFNIYGPLQQTILATGRIRELYNPDAQFENSVLIHEIGHNFGLDHVAQGTGVMEPGCTGKLKFKRASLTFLRSGPDWD